MDKRDLVKMAASSLLAVGMAVPAAASHAANFDKCFGVAKMGQNDCAAISGLNSCKGQSFESYDPADYKLVPFGTCQKVGGLTLNQAKALLKNPAKVRIFRQEMKKRNS